MTLILLSLQAMAQECDVALLRRQLAEATPHQTGAIFAALAKCDSEAARRLAPVTLPRVLPDESGYAALIGAVSAGADAAATTWITALQSDERAKAIRALGEACAASAPVQGYFVARAASLKEDFWDQRWYSGLSDCTVEPIRALLWSEIEAEKSASTDRSQFFSVLSTYARNAGATAVPQIQALLQESTDPEVQVNLVNSFTDAAQVGSRAGMNQATAEKAIRAIVALAPTLTPRAVDQARLTLQTLGGEAQSDELASARYRAVAQGDGTILWGAVVVENAVCKKGNPMQRIHSAQVIDTGRTWADQLDDKVSAATEVGWVLDLAARCKGEGTVAVVVPDAPFADKAAYKAWADEQIRAVTNPAVKKVVRLEEADIRL